MRFIAKLVDTLSGWLRPPPRRTAPILLPTLDLARTPLERRLLGDIEP